MRCIAVLRCAARVGVCILVLSGFAGCGKGLPHDAVAEVGGQEIAKSTFAHWMMAAATSRAERPAAGRASIAVPEPPVYTACIVSREAVQLVRRPSIKQSRSECKQQYESLKDEVLSFLISADWTLGEARALGIAVSSEEVRREFQQIKSQQFPTATAFENYLAHTGLTVDDLLFRVKVNLLASKIQQKVVDAAARVSESQVRNYYDGHVLRFTLAEYRNVRILRARTGAEAMLAKREMRFGVPFATLAKRHLLSGEELKNVTETEGEAALYTAVFGARVGVLNGPVKTPSGYYVFEVTATKRSRRETLGQARGLIEQQLAGNQQQVALRAFLAHYRQNWIAETECRAGYIVADCREYKA